MQLHEVNVLAFQAAQGGFERRAWVVAGADLRGDGDVFAAPGEGVAQQDLGGSGAVVGGCVEEGDTAIGGALHRGQAVALGIG
ncbi:MAG TPA: hypothetical protein VH158_11075 [Gemmatimonadales bacterium]|nr:hypothetical protein [Gemmatimonadales bacterium]